MRRTLVFALVLAVIALAAGVFVTTQTFPSDNDIQRVSLQEISVQLGLDPSALDSPLVRPIIDGVFGPMQDRVRKRVLDESRKSMYLGSGTMVLVTVAGVALIASDHRRRAHRD